VPHRRLFLSYAFGFEKLSEIWVPPKLTAASRELLPSSLAKGGDLTSLPPKWEPIDEGTLQLENAKTKNR
jgi:hypothetical protein